MMMLEGEGTTGTTSAPQCLNVMTGHFNVCIKGLLDPVIPIYQCMIILSTIYYRHYSAYDGRSTVHET